MLRPAHCCCAPPSRGISQFTWSMANSAPPGLGTSYSALAPLLTAANSANSPRLTIPSTVVASLDVCGPRCLRVLAHGCMHNAVNFIFMRHSMGKGVEFL